MLGRPVNRGFNCWVGMMHLVSSIVTYKSDPEQFAATLASLSEAVAYAKAQSPFLTAALFVIENDASQCFNFNQVKEIVGGPDFRSFDRIELSVSSRNLGYGGGHNLAILGTDADYCLVLNPDVVLDREALKVGLDFLSETPQAAVVSPHGKSPSGHPLYLCKQFPRLFDLILRGFGPLWLRKVFVSRMASYEMHDLLEANTPVGVPIVSGCCMLMRGSTVREISGFDENYFLYFEDFDLSLRLGARGKNIYLPRMKIIHYGGSAAKKGITHLAYFMRSALRFYTTYGWRWF